MPATGLALAGTLLLGACDLERDIDVDFPTHAAVPVLECYLTPGEPFRLLLTRSSAIDAPFGDDAAGVLGELLLDSALVTIAFGDTIVVLEPGFAVDTVFRQGFNYASTARVPLDYRDSLRLSVELPDGGTIRAVTRLLRPVPNDSVVVEYDPERLARGDSLARVRTFFSDPDPDGVNRFHHVLLEESLRRGSEQDAILTDAFDVGAALGTVSLYRFAPGTTVRVVTAHVDEVFERYRNSTALATASNGNPYAQPSPLLGNLRGEGALGVFTSYAYTLERVVVPR